MNHYMKRLGSTMTPRAALIAYKCNMESDDTHYLELRAIDAHGRMMEGTPVTEEFMNELALNYTGVESNKPHGRIPRTMLYADNRKGSEKYVWYDSPRKRMMYFTEKLNIDDGEYYAPGLIYEASDSSLKVYSYKGNKVPAEDEALFRGPFFNVSDSSVCLGSARVKKPDDPTFESVVAYWEKMFWMSKFSHLYGSISPTVDNLILVTKAAKDKPFDLDQLKPIDKTLKDILR